MGTTNKDRGRFGNTYHQDVRIYYGNISCSICTQNNPYYITGEWNGNTEKETM